jgi:hypothetical protein
MVWGAGVEASALCSAGRAASRVCREGSRAPAERIGSGGGERGGEDDDVGSGQLVTVLSDSSNVTSKRCCATASRQLRK